jgi:SAM-dependent methyltransferase
MEQIDFGSLRRLYPVSWAYGYDRGRPVDRYYIERFLEEHKADIRGSVLEIGERLYTEWFGGEGVCTSDILDMSSQNSAATVIADLNSYENLPVQRFDCIIATQALQYVFQLAQAVEGLRTMLKPGGILLASFPGLSRTNDDRWGDSWYWNLTSRSALRLFSEVFGEQNVTVKGHGNVLAATAFLYGLAARELEPEELAHYDSGYEVVISVRAIRREISEPTSLS